MQQYYTCPFCGNPAIYGSPLCSYCNRPLTWDAARNIYRQPGKQVQSHRSGAVRSIRGLKITALIAGILGCIIGFAVGILIFFVGLVSIALKYESRYSILARDYPVIGLAALFSFIAGTVLIWPYPRLAGIILVFTGVCSFFFIGELGIFHLPLIIVAGVLSLTAGFMKRSDTAA